MERKRKNTLLMVGLLASSFALSSCSDMSFFSFFSSSSFSSSFFSSVSSSVSMSGTSHVSSEYSLVDGAYYEPSPSSFQDMSLYKHGEYGSLGEGNMPSIGEAKLLVIPICFNGASDPTPSNDDLAAIKAAFFGEKEETGWESLKSYYATSSYGKLNIDGVVTNACRLSISSSDFQSRYERGSLDTTSILEAAVNWAEEEGYIDSSFDTNGDGFLDGVDLIYFTNKTYNDNSDLWWAYTSNYSDNYDYADPSSPVPYRYFWAPMSMIANGYYSPDIDTHTLIHETGHMMGLDDYYSYDKTEGRGGNSYSSEAPCGMVDMMDCNVGDHDAYSKMILGWASPKVVLGDGSFSITLNSFTETGDFLLVPSEAWNGTPYDEYLILQYYTPTGLNEKDSGGYEEFSNAAYGHGGTYAKAGLQVYHVDARVAAYDAKEDGSSRYSYSNLRYSDDPLTPIKQIDDSNYTLNLQIAASNTGSYSIDVESGFSYSKGQYSLTYGSSNRLITFLPANGSNAFLKYGYESNFGKDGLLFTESGSSAYTNEMMKNCYQNNGKFNNGSYFPYSFSVSEQTSSSIKVTFTHL